jgi:FtsP/CotA-like multicopper oxidase with cupredoxin domain
MSMRIFDPSRRAVVAGLAASAAGLVSGGATPPAAVRLALEARAATLPLRPGQPPTPVLELAATSPAGNVRLGRGDRCEITFHNDLPAAVAPAWYGLDGASAAEPLLGRSAVTAGGTETSIVSVPHSGVLMADLRLFEDGLKQPVRPLPVIVQETEPPAVDRDELFLVEDWRLAPDGTAILPGAAGADVASIFTVNGRIAPDLTLRVNERLRLRLINGCQRAVVAVKFDGAEVLVVGLDGQPAEPFIARNGALVLAPGSRSDVLIDGTAAAGASAPILLHDGKEARPLARLLMSTEPPLRAARLPPPQPLSPNGLPEHLDLRGALRFDVALGATDAGWVRASNFSAASAPAFRARAGRTVVLAVKNPASVATVFHLHGHHVRLLDRLDDGWKPYWLDTLALEPGQTQRVAFAASAPGRWLIESVAADWAAPRLVRWYAVE